MHEEIAVSSGGRYWGRGLTEQEILGPVPEPPSFGEAIEAVRERVRRQIGKVTVPKDLSRAHPATSRLLQEDERRREKLRTSLFVLPWHGPLFDSAYERRRLRILNSFFIALTRAGGKPWVCGRNAEEIGVAVHQQNVLLKLDAPPLPRRTSRGDGSPQEGKSSRLRLSILTGSGAQDERITWEDGDAGRVERQMAEIAAEILTAAEVQYRESRIQLHAWRIQLKAQLEEERRIRHAEAERKERERQAALAKERVHRLLTQAASLRQANDIRAYVEAALAAVVGRGAPVDAEALDRWSAWALAEADRIDPVISRAFLAEVGPADGSPAT